MGQQFCPPGETISVCVCVCILFLGRSSSATGYRDNTEHVFMLLLVPEACLGPHGALIECIIMYQGVRVCVCVCSPADNDDRCSSSNNDASNPYGQQLTTGVCKGC
uniref:Putative secreted protein n=1 Tax=Anopheles marajoara TaxID=58244 RepID=A0A2M4C898_9DIPT